MRNALGALFTNVTEFKLTWYRAAGAVALLALCLSVPFFVRATTTVVGPYKVLLRDVDGDGKLDFIEGYHGLGVVVVEKGTGTGGAERIATNVFTNEQPIEDRIIHNMDLGDVDHDGLPDLAIALGGLDSTTPGQLIVAKNMGNGVFQEKWRVDLPSQVKGVKLVDVDKDGQLDLVGTQRGRNATNDPAPGYLHLYRGHGNFTFDSHNQVAVGESAYYVEVGDFNEDGYPDFAIPNEHSDEVHIVLNPGPNVFTAPLTATYITEQHVPGWLGQPQLPGPLVNDVRAADFNHDGHLDLLAAEPSTGTLSIWYGKGDGTFGPSHVLAAGLYAAFLAVGDLDGSGHLGAIVTHYRDTQSVSAFVGSAAGDLLPPSSYPAGLGNYGIDLGDLNGDGKPDAVTANYVADTISVLMNKGDGTFTSVDGWRGMQYDSTTGQIGPAPQP